MERIDRRRLLGGVLNGEVVERVVEAGGRRPCAQEGDAMKIAACLAARAIVKRHQTCLMVMSIACASGWPAGLAITRS